MTENKIVILNENENEIVNEILKLTTGGHED
jgi:hypothetical protein